MKTDLPNETFSTRDAAQLLRVSVRTIQLWVEDGRLQAWKTPGGHRRILRHSVEDMLASRKTQGSSSDFFEILVVEDDPLNLRLLMLQLNSLGSQVRIRSATNGFEALLLIGERCPNLLITDLVMPNLDGLQMLETLRTTPLIQPMQIIVTTGLSDQEVQRRGGLPMGITKFHKPLPYAQLLRLVSAHVEIWHAQGVST